MFRNKERGAVAPLVAILLVLIVVCVALVVDLGHFHNVKVQLQRAVDAAALAGVQQLDGSAIAAQKAIDAALAVVSSNQVDGHNLVLTEEDVLLGNWEKEGLGQSAASRFIIGGTRPDAVMVTASREVDHAFFFFTDATLVTADAIAVNLFEELVLPLAIVSCIPTSGPQTGELTVCGIDTYTFASENENTAGWTSLTLGGQGGPSQQDIMEFLEPGGSELFKEIIEGLDNAGVARGPSPFTPSYNGCEGNQGDSILCGLGGSFSGYTTFGDPLSRYRSLPRYISESPQERQAFLDVLYHDGVLDPRPYLRADGTLNQLAYSTHLELYYTGLVPSDGRFQPMIDGEDNFIKYDKKTNTYSPNFKRVLDYAGYPPVNATTGSMASVMKAVLEDLISDSKGNKDKDVSFKSNLTDFHPPFDMAGRNVSRGYGQTLLLTIPVIFAGSCEDFHVRSKSSLGSHEDRELLYVGMANLLVTRAWKGSITYETEEPVEVWGGFPLKCSAGDFDPQLINGGQFAGPVPPPQKPSPVAFEGLIRPPGLDDEARVGIRKIVLVE